MRKPYKLLQHCAMLSTVAVLLSIIPPTIAHSAPKSASKRTQLQRRKASIYSKISTVRKKLREVKKRERTTTTRLHTSEHNVRVYRGQLVVASLRYKRTKYELHNATLALVNAKADFTDAQRDTRQRLVTMYQRGENGYLDLLLSSDDFGEMLQRIELARYLQLQDTQTLQSLMAQKQKVARYQQVVSQKTVEVAQWKQEVALRHDQANRTRMQVAEQLSEVRDQKQDLQAELDALERDSAAVANMLRQMQNTAAGRRRYNTHYNGSVGGLPVAGRISSGFGYRIHPIYHTRKLHTGLDITAAYGTPIHAAGGGEVVFSGWRGGYGNAVIIDHGGGRATLYGHMSQRSVSAGQVVARGQVIGNVGSTGVSTGPHLHYELRINGRPVSPL